MKTIFLGREHSDTVGTAITHVSAINYCLPLMTVFAQPPYLLAGPSSDVRWSQWCISGGVPLPSKAGIDFLKTIIPTNNFSGAIRTTTSAVPVVNL